MLMQNQNNLNKVALGSNSTQKFEITSSPGHLFAIRGKRKRGLVFKNCSGDEVEI